MLDEHFDLIFALLLKSRLIYEVIFVLKIVVLLDLTIHHLYERIIVFLLFDYDNSIYPSKPIAINLNLALVPVYPLTAAVMIDEQINTVPHDAQLNDKSTVPLYLLFHIFYLLHAIESLHLYYWSKHLIKVLVVLVLYYPLLLTIYH